MKAWRDVLLSHQLGAVALKQMQQQHLFLGVLVHKHTARHITSLLSLLARLCCRPSPPSSQSRLPPLRAASSQLSQAELEELLAENAKLKQLLNTYRDRLSPDQVRV